jgi:hypothetical protein
MLLFLALCLMPGCSSTKTHATGSSTVVVPAPHLVCPPIPERLITPQCLDLSNNPHPLGRELLAERARLLACVGNQNENAKEIRQLQQACTMSQQ